MELFIQRGNIIVVSTLLLYTEFASTIKPHQDNVCCRGISGIHTININNTPSLIEYQLLQLFQIIYCTNVTRRRKWYGWTGMINYAFIIGRFPKVLNGSFMALVSLLHLETFMITRLYFFMWQKYLHHIFMFPSQINKGIIICASILPYESIFHYDHRNLLIYLYSESLSYRSGYTPRVNKARKILNK